MLEIGDKVRHRESYTEGKVVYSTFGASISGFFFNELEERCHFQTLGQPIEELESEWEKIDEFALNMKGYS